MKIIKAIMLFAATTITHNLHASFDLETVMQDIVQFNTHLTPEQQSQLKEELTELGLSTKGKKSVLSKRLEEFLKEE